MRPLAAVAAALLIATASHAQGTQGLHLGWSSCANTDGSLRNVDLRCDPKEPDIYRLYGTFSLAAAVTGIVAVDGVIDFTLRDRPDVPPFWHLQPVTGCNGDGIAMAAQPKNACDSSNSRLLCGPDGTLCDVLITFYGYGAAIGLPENRGRLLFTLARPLSSGAVDLPAGGTADAAHFGFELTFTMDNALDAGTGCDGCKAGTQIAWTQATLFDGQTPARPEAIAVRLDETDPGSTNCAVLANSAMVPVRPTRWGQLKSLYR